MMVLRPPRDLSMVVRLNRNNGVCYHSIPALRIKNPTDHYRLNLTIAIPFKSNGSLPHVCVSLGDLCIDVSFNSLPCPPCWRSAKDEANRRHRRFIVLISTDGGYSLIFFVSFSDLYVSTLAFFSRGAKRRAGFDLKKNKKTASLPRLG